MSKSNGKTLREIHHWLIALTFAFPRASKTKSSTVTEVSKFWTRTIFYSPEVFRPEKGQSNQPQEGTCYLVQVHNPLLRESTTPLSGNNVNKFHINYSRPLNIWASHQTKMVKAKMWCDLGKSVWSQICDVTFSVFYLIEVLIILGEVHFAENHTWIRPVVHKLQAIEGFSKQ